MCAPSAIFSKKLTNLLLSGPLTIFFDFFDKCVFVHFWPWKIFRNQFSNILSGLETFSILFHSLNFLGIFGTLPRMSLTGVPSEGLGCFEFSSAKLALEFFVRNDLLFWLFLFWSPGLFNFYVILLWNIHFLFERKHDDGFLFQKIGSKVFKRLAYSRVLVRLWRCNADALLARQIALFFFKNCIFIFLLKFYKFEVCWLMSLDLSSGFFIELCQDWISLFYLEVFILSFWRSLLNPVIGVGLHFAT